jgi:hypothetical protein
VNAQVARPFAINGENVSLCLTALIQVVSALPIGGVMTGSHNGPSMYLYGTSWDDGSTALCVLHSIAHARLISTASGSGARLSSSGIGAVSVGSGGRVKPPYQH